MNTLIYVCIILIALCSVHDLQLYNNYMKSNTMNVNYYRITPKVGSTMMIKDSGYVLDQISCYVSQSKLAGVNNIDVSVDLRYAKLSTLYKVIGILEHDGYKVSKKQSNPMSLLLNLEWKPEFI